MVLLSMTLTDPDWDVNVAIFLDIEYLRNDTRSIVTIENINKTSYALYRMVIFPMTSTDP